MINQTFHSAARAGVVFAAALTIGALFITTLWSAFGERITNAREEYILKLARETLTNTAHKNHRPTFTPTDETLKAARIIALDCINNDAIIIRAVATRGYGGDIAFVASVINNTIANIRIIRHKETPGIADFLNTPEGGNKAMDTVAHATITTNAITMAINNVLKWQQQTQPCKHNEK